MADPRGRTPPPRTKMFLISAVFGKICMLAPSHGGLAPLPMGNPGSAHGFSKLAVRLSRDNLSNSAKVLSVATMKNNRFIRSMTWNECDTFCLDLSFLRCGLCLELHIRSTMRSATLRKITHKTFRNGPNTFPKKNNVFNFRKDKSLGVF